MVCAVIVVSFVRGLYLDLERADPLQTLRCVSFSTIYRRRVLPSQRADRGERQPQLAHIPAAGAPISSASRSARAGVVATKSVAAWAWKRTM
jgi:hypothetical protein